MKKQLVNGWIFLLAVALLFGVFTMIFIQQTDTRAETGNAVTGGLLNYDDSLYEITEDYTAYVDSVAYEKNEVKLQDPEKIQKRRLDYGKSGILFCSKNTGKDAIGNVFSIEERSGVFTMDFRIFSEKTFTGNIWNVQNTFLDVKKVSVTFTSKTDASKAFTVYYQSKDVNCGLDLNARVAIKGEGYNDGQGYGMYFNGTRWVINESGTYLEGLSFSNFARSGGTYMTPETNSIQLSFDPQTMEVFTTTYLTQALGTGYNVEEKQTLCRDLAKNTIGQGAGAWDAKYEGMNTLSSEDFADGYSISFAIEDMTSDDVYQDEAKDYARVAKVLVYEVCGQSMKTPTKVTATQSQREVGGVTREVYTFTSSTKNELAEDMSVIFDGTDFTSGSYTTIGIVPHVIRMNEYNAAASGNVCDLYNGYGDRMYEHDPYSDIRGITVTYRSKTDESKAFTVYLQSRSTKSAGVIARVGIEGEIYHNAHGSAGFAVYGNNNIYNPDGQYRTLNGTFGASEGIGSADNSNIQIRFNPETMIVEGCAYTNWYVLRDLKTDYSTTFSEVSSGKFSTLLPEDFVGGFTIEVAVNIMNNNTNRGRTVNYNTWNGDYSAYSGVQREDKYILEEGYDRPAVFDIISFSCDHYHVDLDDNGICDGCGEYVSSYEAMKSVSLSLNGDIAVNYYMEFSDDIAESDTSYFEIKIGNKTQQIKVKDAIKETVGEEQLYKFSVAVAAKDASEKIVVQVKNDAGFAGDIYEYSVKDYIDAIQADSTGAYDEVKPLMSALDTYTDFAEAYFNGRGESLEASEEMNALSADMFDEFRTSITGVDERVRILGCSLMLESKTGVRIYYTLSEGISAEAVPVTINGKSLIPKEKTVQNGTDVCYYVEVSGILASKLDMVFSVTIGEITVQTSAMAYAGEIIRADEAVQDEALVNLMKALYLYNQNANKYFNSISQ